MNLYGIGLTGCYYFLLQDGCICVSDQLPQFGMHFQAAIWTKLIIPLVIRSLHSIKLINLWFTMYYFDPTITVILQAQRLDPAIFAFSCYKF